MINNKTTLEELAYIVSGILIKYNIKATLTGGAVVSIYTVNQYQSYDLDFVTDDSINIIEQALNEIGFKKGTGRHFVHNDTKFFVEFIQAPLSIGETLVKSHNILTKNNNTLYLLTPTHCVMDRLAAYYHWNDKQSLEQAILVSINNKIDYKLIETWSKNESQIGKFNTYKARVLKK